MHISKGLSIFHLVFFFAMPSFAGVSILHDSGQPQQQQAPQGKRAQIEARGGDAEAEELIQAKKNYADKIDAINRLNPLSTQTGKPGAPAGDLSKLPEQLKWAKDLIENPRFQKLARLIQDPRFGKAAQEIAQNANLKWLAGGLLLVFVVYLLLKRRVLAATDKLLLRLLFRFILALVFFFMLFLVSYAVLGQPLIEILVAVWKTFLSA